jgi:hypothetical protein
LANFQSAVFYPLNFLYFLPAGRQVLPQPIAWTILVMLQMLLAAFFTYLYGRKIGLKDAGAVLAGLAYGFGGFMTVFLEYNTIGQTICWLPLLLYAVESEKTGLFFFGLITTVLAGHIPSAGLAIGFTLLYILFRKSRAIIKFLFLTLLGLGVCAFQLLPTIELIGQSARVAHDYRFLIEKLLIQARQLIMFLVPDFFGNPATRNYWLTDTYPGKVVYLGLVPLVFALLSLRLFWRQKPVKFFALGGLAILSLMVSWPLTWFIYKFPLPLLSSSSPGNAIFLLSFCLSILAGFGLNYYLENRKTSLSAIIRPLTVFLPVWALVLISKDPNLAVTKRNLLYSSLIALAFIGLTAIFKKFKKPYIFGLIFLTVFDLFYLFRKFNSFVPKDLIYPPTEIFSWLSKNAGINRFWGYGSAGIEANFATQAQVYSVDGYDPLYSKRYGEFIYASREGKILGKFDSSTRSDARIASGFGEEDFSNNPYREKILAVLGVKYILDRVENNSTAKTFSPQNYSLIWEDNGWRVFENQKAAPRAFLAAEYRLFQNETEFTDKFFSPDFLVNQSVLLEEDPLIKPQKGAISQTKIVNYQPNRVEIETEADTSRLLFLSDNYFPGWQAFIDGQPAKIYRADYTLRAVALPQGKHQVLFIYLPNSFALGVKISLISLLLLIGYLYYEKKT